MSLPFDLPPLVTPSIVGFAEAALLDPEAAGDIGRRLADRENESSLEQALDGVSPLILRAIEAANSLHFRFNLVELALEPTTALIVAQGPFVLEGLDEEHPDRKLTVVLPLSGEARIELPSVGKTRRLQTGIAAIFPAFLANEVTPEDALTALVGYAIGPSFA